MPCPQSLQSSDSTSLKRSVSPVLPQSRHRYHDRLQSAVLFTTPLAAAFPSCVEEILLDADASWVMPSPYSS